jgi:hypothetical protein
MNNGPISDLRMILRAALRSVGDSFAQGQDVPNRGQRLDQAAARLERAVRANLRTGSERLGQHGWAPSDLDRCEHGRHSIDSCFDCPGGVSAGNLYLDPLATQSMETRGMTDRRIGTTVHAEPIWATPNRRPRSEENEHATT